MSVCGFLQNSLQAMLSHMCAGNPPRPPGRAGRTPNSSLWDCVLLSVYFFFFKTSSHSNTRLALNSEMLLNSECAASPARTVQLGRAAH